MDPVTDAPAPEPVTPTLDLDAVTADLAAVEAALERLDAGTYGRCLACDEPIADDDLAAAPAQPTCAAHLFTRGQTPREQDPREHRGVTPPR